jgi:hypothetical protein
MPHSITLNIKWHIRKIIEKHRRHLYAVIVSLCFLILHCNDIAHGSQNEQLKSIKVDTALDEFANRLPTMQIKVATSISKTHVIYLNEDISPKHLEAQSKLFLNTEPQNKTLHQPNIVDFSELQIHNCEFKY